MDESPETIPKEQYLRLAADFENYRKGEKKRVTDLIQFGQEKLLLEIIEIIDALELGEKHGSEGPINVKGLLEKILQKQGVERIETMGRPFDPMMMEAITMAEGGESHQVKEEIRAGYRIQDRIIRPARVIIYQ